MRQLKNNDVANADGTQTMFNYFRKNQSNEVEIFKRKCNSLIKDGKVTRSKSYTNKYTIKETQICLKKMLEQH